jgi:hypothetical protein
MLWLHVTLGLRWRSNLSEPSDALRHLAGPVFATQK